MKSTTFLPHFPGCRWQAPVSAFLLTADSVLAYSIAAPQLIRRDSGRPAFEPDPARLLPAAGQRVALCFPAGSMTSLWLDVGPP